MQNKQIAEPELDQSERNMNSKKGKSKPFFSLVVALLIVAVSVMIFKWMKDNPKVAKKAPVAELVPEVLVIEAKTMEVTPTIETQGEAMPTIRTQILCEVQGAIVELSPHFWKGEKMSKGEVLLRVDDLDYQTALTQAQADLAAAELALAQEQARAKQARRDWARLGNGREPSELVLRIPQIRNAKGQIEAAYARHAKAQRDLSKTTIRVPYDCLVEQKMVSEGGFVRAMSPVAEVYSSKKMEVRLPIRLDQLGYLPAGGGLGNAVVLEAHVAGKLQQWQGKIARFEGGVDSKTASKMMVVEVDSSSVAEGGVEIPSGLFLNAKVSGATLKDVIGLPKEALRGSDSVWILDAEQKLEIRKVQVIMADRELIYLSDGVQEGERVITSGLDLPKAGTQLKLSKPKNSESKQAETQQEVKEHGESN